MSEWRVEIEEEPDGDGTLAVYVGKAEVGRYCIVNDPEKERELLTQMIGRCVEADRRDIVAMLRQRGCASDKFDPHGICDVVPGGGHSRRCPLAIADELENEK